MIGYPPPGIDRSSVRRFDIKRVRGVAQERVIDTLAVEEPLAIHLAYWSKSRCLTENLAIAMRTPGYDRELAAGYLVGEGIVRSLTEVTEVRSLGADASEVIVELADTVDVDSWKVARGSYVSSACGICGKKTIASLAAAVEPLDSGSFVVERSLIECLPELLRQRQPAFEQTGGLHAAAAVNAYGVVEAVFEDIGRHNALDKLVGHLFLAGRLPLSDRVLFMSSRGSYELVQKAVAAGFTVLATVGGPSSLAVEAARNFALTLIGFVRAERFNVYSGEWRLKL